MTLTELLESINLHEEEIKKTFCPSCGNKARKGNTIAGYTSIQCDTCKIQSLCDIGGGEYEPENKDNKA